MNNNQSFSFPNSSSVVLDRVMEAYGFTTKIQLALHFGMAASSLTARYKRDIFPADMVIQCSLETGANLEWLTYGTGSVFESMKLDLMKIEKFALIEGSLYQSGYYMLDKALFLQSPLPSSPICLSHENVTYIIDKSFNSINDGEWLIIIDDEYSLRTLTKMPQQKVRVSNAGISFDCDMSALEVAGKVSAKFEVI